MRKFDETGLALADMQGCLFELSADHCSCSSAVFIRRFMNSNLAKRMDSPAFLGESCSLESMFQELDEQYGPSNYGKIILAGETLYWMGYLYRYWCYVFEQTSSAVFKIANSKELSGLYEPYHALDPKAAIERILEAKELVVPQDLSEEEQRERFTERGVESLRALQKKKLGDSYFEYYFGKIADR